MELVWVGNCRKANGVLCDKKVPPRLKGFYKTKIRLISKKKRQQLDQQYFMEWNVRQKKKKVEKSNRGAYAEMDEQRYIKRQN